MQIYEYAVFTTHSVVYNFTLTPTPTPSSIEPEPGEPQYVGSQPRDP